MSKKQQNQESIAKIIERENVISYKRKPPSKVHPKSHNENQDGDSAYSLKSGIFSENGANGTVTRLTKNTPLPQLSKQRKRFNMKNITVENKLPQSYFDKEVRLHDNLILKQKNNLLATENMKLKTRIMTLQKQIFRLQRAVDEDKSKLSGPFKQIRFKPTQSVSMKIVIKNMRKELEEVKAQNNKIKWSIKFTTINQLQIQRDSIMEQNSRLRQMLEDQQNRRLYLKANQQGYSQIESRVIGLQDKTKSLTKQNIELKKKIDLMGQNMKNTGKIAQNQRNLNRMLFNSRRVIKEKEKQIDLLKAQIKMEANSGIFKSIEKKDPLEKYRERISHKKEVDKKITSKSAQKYRTTQQNRSNTVDQNLISQKKSCNNCKQLLEKIQTLEKEIQNLNYALKEYDQVHKNDYIQLPKQPVKLPLSEEKAQIQRFLIFRFKAHHLSLQESKKYLINSEINSAEMQKSITVNELVQNLVAQPFSFVNNRYIQVCVLQLMYLQVKSQNINIESQKSIKKKLLLQNYEKMVKKFDLTPQQRQEQMFIQIAELVTNYHQQILTALSNKKNGQGTINENELVAFFKQIQLEKQYIDFIITQIILQSVDLERLNYYALFQIFYMPTQENDEEGKPVVNIVHGKKYNVIENVVKQQDEQYEQSRSYVEARQKTFSKNSEGANNGSQAHMQQQSINQNPIDEYAENFEQQKIEQVPEEEKANEQKKSKIEKPYALDEDIAVYDDYQDQFDT